VYFGFALGYPFLLFPENPWFHKMLPS